MVEKYFVPNSLKNRVRIKKAASLPVVAASLPVVESLFVECCPTSGKVLTMTPHSEQTWFQIAMSRQVVVRGLLCAALVGVVLCAINHADCLWSGKFGWPCAVKAMLTATVPYVVSVVSSVHALRNQHVS